MSLADIARRAEGEIEAKRQRVKYRTDPALWAYDMLGIKLWSKQREIGESLVRNRGTLVASGHGTGKSFVEAVYGAWWVDTFYDEGVFLATTAPSAAQINVFWDYLRKFHVLMLNRFKEGVITRKPIGYVTGANQWKDENGIIIGEGRKPPTNMADVAFQGRHAPYLLAIADEAVGVPAGFIEALGNIATGENNRQLLVANPTSLKSRMYQLWDGGDEMWHRISISVYDSPLMKPDPYLPAEEADGMSGPEFVSQKLKEYGSEDDSRFKARVKGVWAQDSGDSVYEPEELARAKDTVVVVDPGEPIEFGVDVAGMGADASVIYRVEYGEVWETDDVGERVKGTGKRGMKVRKVDSWTKTPLAGGTPEKPDSVMKVDENAKAYGASTVKVDASGIGVAVTQGLVSNSPPYRVIEVFSGAPSEDKRTYVNLRAEQFFRVKKMLQEGVLDLDASDEVLFTEAEGLQYEETERQLLKIESKDSMRRRGVKSPDFLDAAFQFALLPVDDFLSEEESDPILELAGEDFGWAENVLM